MTDRPIPPATSGTDADGGFTIYAGPCESDDPTRPWLIWLLRRDDRVRYPVMQAALSDDERQAIISSLLTPLESEAIAFAAGFLASHRGRDDALVQRLRTLLRLRSAGDDG